MNLAAKELNNTIVLSPVGRIDHQHADNFSALVAPHLEQCTKTGKPLVLDFSAVEYVSSVGLRALMLISRRVTAQSGRIAIASLQPAVREVFHISRFDMLFKVFDNLQAATEAFN